MKLVTSVYNQGWTKLKLLWRANCFISQLHTIQQIQLYRSTLRALTKTLIDYQLIDILFISLNDYSRELRRERNHISLKIHIAISRTSARVNCLYESRTKNNPRVFVTAICSEEYNLDASLITDQNRSSRGTSFLQDIFLIKNIERSITRFRLSHDIRKHRNHSAFSTQTIISEISVNEVLPLHRVK